MKTREILFLFAAFFLLSTSGSQAQILKKLKSKVEKTIEDEITGEGKSSKTEGESTDEASASESDSQEQAQAENPVSSYKSKFDFVPGEQLILWEDFEQDAIGDFPALWYTNGSGEVVTVDGREGKWLMIKGRSEAYIDQLLNLPDNFTIQFDLLCSMPFSWFSDVFNIYLEDIKDLEMYRNGQKGGGEMSDFVNLTYHFWLNLHPGKYNPGTYSTKGYGNYSMRSQGAKIELDEIWMPTPEKQLIQVSIWRQGQRLRVYLNENKILDLPKILPPDMKPNLLVFEPYDLEEEDAYFLGNLRIAVGNPDTRNKLLTEGKLVTNGIYFNVNSDKIKPESYGVLKEISGILKESKANVKIVGHTDSDGDDSANLELSKRRAEAVKKALVDEFGLDAGTLQIEGKGESEPVEPNSSAINKAKNRRVEFIKIG